MLKFCNQTVPIGCPVWQEIMKMETDSINGHPIFVASFEVQSQASVFDGKICMTENI